MARIKTNAASAAEFTLGTPLPPGMSVEFSLGLLRMNLARQRLDEARLGRFPCALERLRLSHAAAMDRQAEELELQSDGAVAAGDREILTSAPARVSPPGIAFSIVVGPGFTTDAERLELSPKGLRAVEAPRALARKRKPKPAPRKAGGRGKK